MYKDTVETRIKKLNKHEVNSKFKLYKGFNRYSNQYVKFSANRGNLQINFICTYLNILIPYVDITEFAIDDFEYGWIRIKTKGETFLFIRKEDEK